jgi:hypothetical protein
MNVNIPIHPDSGSMASFGYDPDGEAERLREERRADGLRDLAELRRMGMHMARQLIAYVDGRLPEEEALPFVQIKDPTVSLERITLFVRRIVAQEDRLLEDAKSRALRLAAELAERERALLAEQRRRERQPLEDKKQLVRRAVALAHREMHPGKTREQREDLLDDLFDEIDEFCDYEGDPTELVADIFAQFAADPAIDLSWLPDFNPSIRAERNRDKRQWLRLQAWARECVNWVNGTERGDPTDRPPANPAHAQGPPAQV